jgi:hypothetical protein
MVMEAIKKGFSMAARSLGLVSVLFAVNFIFNLAGMPLVANQNEPMTAKLGAAMLGYSLVFALISIFIQGGTLGLIRDGIKEGGMKLGNFSKYGGKYYLRLLGLGAVIILMVAAVALISGLVIAATASINNAVVTAVAIVVAIAIAITIGLLYFIPFTLSPYAIVCDDLGVIAAMKKCVDVARNPFSRLLFLILLFLLLILIGFGVGYILGILLGLVSTALPSIAGRVLTAVVASAVNGYLGVVMMTAVMTFYLKASGKMA